jgi:ubiquinone/menaquinone biosynthesis C-methylase UbiE
MTRTHTFDDLHDLFSSWRIPFLVAQAHELGVFDATAGGWKEAEEIAARLGTDERATGLLLVGLCGAGVLEKAGSRFRNTEMVERRLIRRSPEYDGALLSLAARQMRTWLEIPQVLKTGAPVQRPEPSPEEARARRTDFLQAMHAIASREVDALFNALPLKDGMHVIDVGAGPATYLAGFASRLPNLTGVAFDRPTSREVADGVLERAGVAERIRFVGGDFTRDALEGSFDGALLSHVLHLLDPDRARDLIARVARIIRPHGFIAISEMAADQADRSGQACVFAIQMMLTSTGGAVYSVEEMGSWLSAEGFQLETVTPLGESSTVLVGRRGA